MVNVDFWYVVQAEGCRPHFCSNYYLAQAVVRNLKERYAAGAEICRLSQHPLDNLTTSNAPRVFFLDRGSMSHRRPIKTLSLPEDINVSWLAHEQELIRKILVDEFPLAAKKYGSFFKIHCNPNTLCLTMRQGQWLYDCIVKGFPGANYLRE